MYKLLLCWRYLLTRYLALVCIISVMLGVATLIVVNSVMAGFSTKLRDRLHGVLSDVVVESFDLEGIPACEELIARILRDPYLASQIEAATPTLECPAMIQFTYRGTQIMKPVRMIGIDPEGRARIGGFAQHLLLAEDKNHPTFNLNKEGMGNFLKHHPGFGLQKRLPPPKLLMPGEKPEPTPPDFANQPEPLPEGAIIGYALAHFRNPKSTPEKPLDDICALEPGEEVVLTTVSGAKLAPVNARFVVSDYIKTEMSEYDSNYVFVSLKYLQDIRCMEGRATSIQIRLKDESQSKQVVERLTAVCANERLLVATWQDKQGPLLSAIAVERGLLNVLLFMIILVAGFGILAIFSMIVVEKTRDIGILKALGASNGGVMKIFLAYGLLLGMVGALCGTGMGLGITIYINEIEHFITQVTGQEIFNRSTYYFDKIPTDIQPFSVVLVNIGAIGIAVLFSVMPALRAAMLNPVRALRYE